MGTLKDLKYKMQEIMTEKDEEASVTDAYTDQLEKRILKFDDVISSLERAFNSKQIVRKRNPGAEDQEQKVEFQRKLSRRSS